MRNRIILYFKTHPKLVLKISSSARLVMTCWSWFVPVRKKTIIFNSFGGRGFNDSPKALYDEICRRKEFDDWRLLWAFVDPSKQDIPRGEKVKIDTYAFFKSLLYSHVWIGNTGVDRGIELRLKRHIRIETWHGTPLKKICGEENIRTFAFRPAEYKGPIDNATIRCAQSEFDRDIFARVFHATNDSFLVSDLPRNDELFRYSKEDVERIKKKLKINGSKKVILYTPTYREYLINDNHKNYIAPPMDLKKWEAKLSGEYVLLIRAHYAISSAMDIGENDFVKDVSEYPSINDLYAISDMMISDYSSTYFDYAILDRPIFCFAYDLEEYEEKRGLYLDLANTLPCNINRNENELICEILSVDYNKASEKTRNFHMKFAPYAGNASCRIVDELIARFSLEFDFDVWPQRL